jgi:hypothetical protein
VSGTDRSVGTGHPPCNRAVPGSNPGVGSRYSPVFLGVQGSGAIRDIDQRSMSFMDSGPHRLAETAPNCL